MLLHFNAIRESLSRGTLKDVRVVLNGKCHYVFAAATVNS